MSIKFNNIHGWRNLAVKATQAAPSFPTYTTSTLVKTIADPNNFGTRDNDFFGIKAKMAGNYALVSSQSEDSAAGSSVGVAYLFQTTTGDWTDTALIHTFADAAWGPSDTYGEFIELSTDYAIVASEADFSQGRLHIYNTSTQTQLHVITNPNAFSTGLNDTFGSALGLSGDYLIVGARQEDTTGANSTGVAYIINCSTGAVVNTLNNPNAFSTSAGDQFGKSVAIDGNYLAVGADQEDDAGGANSGKVYIFKTDTGDWTDAYLLHTLDNPNNFSTTAEDRFGGLNMAMKNGKLVASALSEDSATGGQTGVVYVFDVLTGSLQHTLVSPTPSLNDNFGTEVSMDGNYIAVATRLDDSTGTNSGVVHLFESDTGNLAITINNPNVSGTTAEDWFGTGMAISGDAVIATAYSEDYLGTNAGVAYIFTLS